MPASTTSPRLSAYAFSNVPAGHSALSQAHGWAASTMRTAAAGYQWEAWSRSMDPDYSFS